MRTTLLSLGVTVLAVAVSAPAAMAGPGGQGRHAMTQSMDHAYVNYGNSAYTPVRVKAAKRQVAYAKQRVQDARWELSNARERLERVRYRAPHKRYKLRKLRRKVRTLEANLAHYRAELQNARYQLRQAINYRRSERTYRPSYDYRVNQVPAQPVYETYTTDGYDSYQGCDQGRTGYATY